MPSLPRWKLIAFLFAIPVISGAIFQFDYARTESAWIAERRKELGAPRTAELEKWSIEAICKDATNRARVLECTSQPRLARLRTLASTTAVGTAFLLLWIWWAGQKSRRDRQ